MTGGGVRREIPPNILARMGVDSDANVARDMGLSRERVRQIRKLLGIPSKLVAQRAAETQVIMELVGRMRKLPLPLPSMADTAAMLGMDHAEFMRLWNRAAVLGMKDGLVLRPRGRPLSSRQRDMERRDKFRRLWEAGVLTADIALAMGWSQATQASSLARRMGLPARLPRRVDRLIEIGAQK